MFRPFPLFSLIECSAFFFRSFGFWLAVVLVSAHSVSAKKVSSSVIIASIVGEVSSLNMVDDFKVQMGASSVGKKINPKTILSTGKTGKIALLFSNGTLITIKPGSRFYLRTYKQLEGIVEGSVDPGKLTEEPTQSELSGHLDYGDLVVKAPKLKKGSSMKLTSPLGVAGIRGTMFQLMAVRNSVTGDIMGGINLISGDIDFTDTGGNTVSLLSGQSIQLATSKLGAPVASKTGELVDLTSTYGPALTDGFTPPTPQSIFPNLTATGDSESEDSESEEDSFVEPSQQTVASSGGTNFEFIHDLATDLFFEIEEAETSSSEFSFESMALAPTVDIPTPQPETPIAPPSVTGETIAGGDLEFFQGGHPELQLLSINNSNDPLVKNFDNGARMLVEMRAPSEGITWRKIDPWVKAEDFLGNDITAGVQILGTPDILLANANSAETDAPAPGASVSYEVSYTIRDLRGLNTVIFRQVDVIATRPSIEIAETSFTVPLSEPSSSTFFQWINSVVVEDVRGNRLPYKPDKSIGGFYLEGTYDLDTLGTTASLNLVATDWRGLTSRLSGITISVVADDPIISGDLSFHSELSDEIISELTPPISAIDEFGRLVDNIVLFNVVNKSNNLSIDVGSQVDELKQGEIYEFIYLIEDSREVNTTKTLDFHVKVTSPTLESFDFNSSFITAIQSGVLEYGDPNQELEVWLTDAKAEDYNGVSLTVSKTYQENGVSRTLEQIKTANPYNGSDNQKIYTVSFSVVDSRWKSGTDVSWESYLKVVNSHELKVQATPPLIDVFFHEPRPTLPSIDHESNKISYLVRSKGDYIDLPQFQDDGPFAILADPGEGNRDSRKLYYNVTAYGGLGVNITDLDLVEVDQTVDDTILNSDSTIKLSIDDQAIRGSDVNEGAQSESVYTVDIVDVISPLISVIDHDDPIEGILPEIYLLNGSSKQDQVQGNSDEQYYFPDPGLIIRDNYYTEEEITEYNNISVGKEYVFEYLYDSESKTYNSVWEFPNRSLDISVVGSYEIFYSLNDPSGNLSKNFDEPNSDDVSRQVNVVDSRAPVVKLYGSSTMYVDLQSIIDEESRYSDPGAYAIENLYVAGKGLFDWTTSDSELSWDVSFSICNDLENDTYDEPENLGFDLIETTIQGYLNDPTSLPTEAVRFKVTYALEDKPFLTNSPNEGSVTRIVELRGSPNLFPHIYFVLNHPEYADGIPPSEISGKSVTLPSLIWDVEVGIDQFSSAPNALVFNDLGGGVIEEVQYSTELLFFDENNITKVRPIYSYNLSDYLQKVNYWDSDTGFPNYVEFNQNSNSYQKYPKDDANWRRVVLRYTSAVNALGNKSIRDLEVRLKDETPPTIQKIISSNQPIEVGQSFSDPGVEIFDAAGSSVALSTSFGENLNISSGQDINQTLEELENRGFWETGDFTLLYNATDEFGNSAVEQKLDIIVQQSINPYVAVLTHDALRKYNSGINLNSSDLSYENESNLLVSPNDRFKKDLESNNALKETLNALTSDPDHYDNLSFDSDDPYIKEFESSSFHLFSTELDSDILQNFKVNPENLVSATNKEVVIQDDLGRTYRWYSPFELKFKNSNNQISTLQDPGFLIFEPSNSGVEVSTTIGTQFYGEDQDQIKSISVTITVSQSNNAGLQTTSESREYIFLDDVKPLITATPNTDENSSLIVVEAGMNFDVNTSGRYRIMRDGVFGAVEGETVSLSTYDIADFPESPGPIVSTVTNLRDPTINQIFTGWGYVNDKYKIEYNVDDSQGNAADPVERFIIIKDTISPVVSGSTDTVVVDYTVANDIDVVKEQLLVGVSALDYGYYGSGDIITPNEQIVWEVNITKPESDPDSNRSFIWNPHLSSSDVGVFYPFDKNDPGYDVTITATDAYGNTSDPLEKTLKIEDTEAPEITLVGDLIIHDFLRFSTNTGFDSNNSLPNNGQLLFADQNSGESFDSSGFEQGTHRIILGNYTFVDPGAYAEDANTYFSKDDKYPDTDGDGIGETWAFRRVSSEVEMEACEDIGVIYIYSALHDFDDPVVYYQNVMQNDIFGDNTNSTKTPTGNVKVPNVNDRNYTFQQDGKNEGIHLDVVKVINKYRVRDGWDNKSEIVERIIYIYESRQFPNFAFYATPLTQGDGTEFEDYYDDGTGRSFLNDTRKDTDRDGFSDYWEKVFGSNPLDTNDVPVDENDNPLDLSDPSLYTGESINFNPANP